MDILGVFVRTCAMHIYDSHLAPIHRGFQERKVTVDLCLKPPRILIYSWVTTMFQKHAQANQVESVRPWAVVLGMLERMGINSQEVDCAVGRVAVFQREDLFEERAASCGASGHNPPTTIAWGRGFRMVNRGIRHFTLSLAGHVEQSDDLALGLVP